MKYIIVGRDTCRWCNQSRQLLDEKKYKYELIDSHELNPKHNFYKYIPTDYNFIPKILLINKKNITWIGGYEDLVKYINSNKNKNKNKSKSKVKSKRKLTRKVNYLGKKK